jgi:hypothetical protein
MRKELLVQLCEAVSPNLALMQDPEVQEAFASFVV